MSAFVVSKSHINAIIMAGMAVRYKPLSWYHGDERFVLTDETADRVGQMLLDECVRSVSYRYDDTGIASLPGRTNAEWLMPFQCHPTCNNPTPLQALKLIGCYEYQSCEHPEWETSEARSFCEALRTHTICRLPGYEEALWTWEDKEYYRVDEAVRLL